MAVLKFTRAARGDFKEIGLYTKRKWGALQQKRYLKSLLARCQWLAENPGLGANRDEILPGYRSYPEGEHVMVATGNQCT